MKKIFSLVLSLFIAFNINAGDGLAVSITGCIPCISNSKIIYGADLIALRYYEGIYFLRLMTDQNKEYVTYVLGHSKEDAKEELKKLDELLRTKPKDSWSNRQDIEGQQFKTSYGYWTLRRNDMGAPYGWGFLFRQDYVSGEAYIGKPHIRHMLKEIEKFKE